MVNPKKIVAAVAVFLVCTALFAKSKKKTAAKTPQPPAWLSDYETLYPRDKFIARLGTGDTRDAAVNDSVGQLAAFFDSEISRVIEGSSTLTEGSAQHTIDTSTTVKSSAKLQGIETLDYNDGKTWHALSYLDKEKTLVTYDAKIATLRDTVASLREKAFSDKNTFKTVLQLKKAQAVAAKMVEAVCVASVLAPAGRYNADLSSVEKLSQELQAAKEDAPLFLNLAVRVDAASDVRLPKDTGDTSGVSAAIKTAFQELGFSISNAPSDYVLDVYLTLAVSAENSDDLTMYTQKGGTFAVSLKCLKDASTCYSYSKQFSKYSSYNFNKIFSHFYPLVITDIQESLLADAKEKL